MPKVGNYVQRDYHSKYSAKRKSRWTSYNKAWGQKRSSSIQKSQQLREVLNNYSVISSRASQANTSLLLQNRGSQGPYANSTAVASRVNLLI
jgi:hypothetical protein